MPALPAPERETLKLAILTGLYVGIVCTAQVAATKIVTIPWLHDVGPGRRVPDRDRARDRRARPPQRCEPGRGVAQRADDDRDGLRRLGPARRLPAADRAREARLPRAAVRRRARLDLADRRREPRGVRGIGVDRQRARRLDARARSRLGARARDEPRLRAARLADLHRDRVRSRQPGARRGAVLRKDAGDGGGRAPARLPDPALRDGERIEAGVSPVDHGQGRRQRRRGQRARPPLRQGRPLHARRRGGVHAARPRDARPRPAHRHRARVDRGRRARVARQRRADAVGDRDRDAGLPHAGRRRPRAAEAARATSARSRAATTCASARPARTRSACSSASGSRRATATARSSTSCSTSRAAS